MTRLGRKLWCGAAVVLTAALAMPAGAQSGPEDALKLVPADALGCIIIRDVKATSDRIQKLAADLGQQDGVDVLQMVKSQFGVDKGLAENGTLAVVVLNPMMYQQQGMFVAAVPTKDAKVLMKELAAEAPAEGGPAVFNSEMAGPLSVVPKGSYLLIGKDKQAVEAVASAAEPLKLSPAIKPWLGKHQVFVLAGVSPIVDMVRTYIPMLMMGGMGAMGGDNSKQAMLMQTIADLTNAAAQIDQLCLAANVDNDGLQLRAALGFKPETTGAKMMDGKTNTKESLLSGLPGDGFVFAMGARSDPEVNKIIGAWRSQMVKNATELQAGAGQGQGGKDAEALKQTMNKMQEISEALTALYTGQSIVIAPAPKGEKGLLRAAWNMKVTDSKKAMDLLEQMIPLFRDSPGMEAMPPIDLKRDAEKAGGLSVSKLVIDVSKAEGQAEQIVPMLQQVFGSEVVEVRMAAVSPTLVTATLGGAGPYFQTVAEVAKSGKAPLGTDAGIAKVAKMLPAEKSAEIYVDAAQIARMAAQFGGEGDQGPATKPAADMAPVAAALSTGDSMGRFEIFVPMGVIKMIAAQAAESGMGGHRAPVAPMPPPPSED